ncbi:MAG: hypothetical protein IKO65_11720, partial [Victivallales bacterium]|nr:hypothetical protein [Victivallales bacterium]
LQTDANGQKYAVFRITIGGESDDMQDITLKSGWNLVPFKLTPTDNGVNDIFSKDGNALYTGVVWEFTGGRYIEAKTVQAGKAYWLYSKANATIQVTGSRGGDSISLEEGWNLIGPLCDVNDFEATYKTNYPDVFSKIATNETGGLEIYRFDYDDKGNSYYTLAVDATGAYKLDSRYGYWIKTTQAVDLPFIETE